MGAGEQPAGTELAVRILWDRLLPSAANAAGDRAERVQRSTMRFDSSTAFAAYTSHGPDACTVSVHLGILLAMIETGRIVASVSSNPELADPTQSPQEAVDEAGRRIASTLGWLTSVARRPIPTSGHRLGSSGDTFATGLLMGAIAFVLAHELGHVASGPPKETGTKAAHAREYAADLWAARLLRTRPLPPASRDAIHPLATVALDPDLTLPAAALFLSFEGLRQRAEGVAEAYSEGEAPADEATLFTVTANETHPSPYVRIAHLRVDALVADPDGSEVEGIDAIIRGFDELLSAIERNMPEHALDKSELLGAGIDPSSIAPDQVVTWDTLYRANIVGLLRGAARRGALLDAEVAALEDMVNRLPRTTIDTLADAVAGNLLDRTDPDAAAVAVVARTLPARFVDARIGDALTGTALG